MEIIICLWGPLDNMSQKVDILAVCHLAIATDEAITGVLVSATLPMLLDPWAVGTCIDSNLFK